MTDHDDPSEAPSSAIDMDALLEGATAQITEQALAHPLRTLGIAFGVGYVLGGGVPRFVVRLGTAALLRTAGRAAIAAVPWSRVLERFTAGDVDEVDEVDEVAPAPPRKPRKSRKSPAQR